MVPILASVPFGCGFLLIFTAINNYIIDSYTLYAASALAANAVQRSILGTIFPLFSVKLYKGLGLNWAGTCKWPGPRQYDLANMTSDRISGLGLHAAAVSVLQVRSSSTPKITIRSIAATTEGVDEFDFR